MKNDDLSEHLAMIISDLLFFFFFFFLRNTSIVHLQKNMSLQEHLSRPFSSLVVLFYLSGRIRRRCRGFQTRRFLNEDDLRRRRRRERGGSNLSSFLSSIDLVERFAEKKPRNAKNSDEQQNRLE